MRILVTGSTGHVGGAIARQLHANGNEVFGLARGTSAALPSDIMQVEADIGHPDFLKDARRSLPRFDAVVHAAAAITGTDDTTLISRTNCVGTDQVCALAAHGRTQRLIYISSVAVYGMPRQTPVLETHPLSPESPYAASKLYGERVVAASGISGAVFRITSPVGPGLRHQRIFSIFVRHALAGIPVTVGGKGTRRQNYVDVRDIARAVEDALKSDASVVCNIAGAVSISNIELAQKCKAVLASASEVVLDGRPDAQEGLSWDVSSELARKHLGYAPRHAIEDSIRALANETTET